MGIDVRQAYRDKVKNVRAKLEKLPPDSCMRVAFSGDMVEQIIQEIERKAPNDFILSTWPPLFCFVERNSVEAIQALHDDLHLVISHSGKEKASEIYRFLKIKEAREDRYWFSGVFEAFVKSRFLRQKDFSVELDWRLSNGRNVDLRAELDGKRYCFECSMMTESEEDKAVWEKYIDRRRVDPHYVLRRPGDLDPPDSRSPSLFYDCVRFFVKVYDKLSKDLNPTRGQMCEDSPNAFLLSIHGSTSPLSAESMGIGWALDELFADQPKERFCRKSELGTIDTSFLGWLQFKADDLIEKGRLDRASFDQWSNKLIFAPRKLGAIFLFDDCVLNRSRVNYNANAECQVSHKEMAKFDEILRNPPSYCL